MNEGAKKYIDSRGWKYKVLPGIGGDCFKVAYQKPEKSGSAGWHRSPRPAFPWRKSFEEAQEDLDSTAKAEGWKEWNG